MAQLEGFRVQNFRSLNDVQLGRTIEQRQRKPLPRMVALIGPNGSGKSALMDAFGFLSGVNHMIVSSVHGEKLAEALGKRPEACTGADKVEWAKKISPCLRLDPPAFPSLRAFLRGVERMLQGARSTGTHRGGAAEREPQSGGP